MKEKQKIDLVCALILILLGIALLVMPLLNITSIKWLSIGIFAAYTVIHLVQFILTIQSKDYEGLHSAIASIVALVATILWNPTGIPKRLAMILMLWIILMSLTKLKKSDYYHDRKDRMWKYSATNLALFILTGILASINLAYSSDVQILVLGFFMLINGILELFEPIVKTLIAHS